MSFQLNIHEAKTRFSWLLRRVQAGEEAIIASNGRPIARIVPYQSARSSRVPGTARGLITLHEDFDAPLPEEFVEALGQ